MGSNQTNSKLYSIESRAKPGELFLKQFCVQPWKTDMRNKRAAHKTLRAKYPGYKLRFLYEDLEIEGKRVSSIEYGRLISEAGTRHDNEFGGAVFGIPKLVTIVQQKAGVFAIRLCKDCDGRVKEKTYLGKDERWTADANEIQTFESAQNAIKLAEKLGMVPQIA